MQVIQLKLFGVEPDPQPDPPRFQESVTDIFTRVYRQKAIGARRKSRGVNAEVGFRAWANANGRIRLGGETLHVHLSDLWRAAPPAVVESLAEILVSKLFRQAPAQEHSDRYREWVNTEEVHNEMVRLRRERGRKSFAPAFGLCHDLDALFDRLNQEYFQGLLSRPRLGWSRAASATLLGHYDPPHHAIVLNRLLDSPEIPPPVVEFVLYHEMLHILHPVELRGGRRHIHTKAFRIDEKRFAAYDEARRYIRRRNWREF
ncbi:MAG: hypothetical protein C0504_03535 [Candidatus Solibacter sp.]|nr:hypothetical protein [Candidatus Solibacter sp.]